jgi:excisionase family DNA binding protein
MAVELNARDVERAEPLDEVLSSPGATLVDEHGHEVKLPSEVAGFVRAALAAARGSGKVLLFAPNDTMSPAEAAELLGVSRPMVYRYIEDGLLEDRPVNTYHRIPASSVHRLAAERRTAARSAARLLREDPDHPRVAAARERVRARRAARDT